MTNQIHCERSGLGSSSPFIFSSPLRYIFKNYDYLIYKLLEPT
jgi:hypothetical protein